MAIYYGNGTLNPASTTLAHDVRRAWKGGFDAAIAAGKTNWSVVEHDLVNGTTQRTVISNSLGFVFVITTSTTTSVTTINTYIGAGYTTPNITGLGMGLTSGTNVSGTTNANGVHTGTYNPNAIQTSTNPAAHGSLHRLTATAAQSAWTVHVENEYAIVSFKDTATTGKWIYVGQYTSLVENTSITDDKPYCLAFSTQTSSPQNMKGAIFVQSPGNGSLTLNQSAFVPGGAAWSLPSNGGPADSTYIDKYSLEPTKANVSPIYVSRQHENIVGLTATSGATAYGWLQGKLNGVYHAASSGAAYGDTVSVDSQTYMYVGGNSYFVSTSATTTLALWAKIS